MGQLDGRVAIVTGAGRGIGEGIARQLAAEGASVVVNDLGVAVDGSGPEASVAEKVAEEIRGAGGIAVANTDDVADFDAAERMVRQAIDHFGRLDVVANVAGILRDRMIFNMSEAEWNAVIRVHLNGTFNTTRHASAYWRELRDPSRHLRLINFTSIDGLQGSPGHANYAAAKMGIVGLTYSCANALSKYGVTANAIAPGAATRMTESVPEGRRRVHRQSGDERDARQIAPTVAYLASPESGWCNGQVISVRGYEIGLYNKPEIIRLITSPVAWDPSRAGEAIERVFRPVVAP